MFKTLKGIAVVGIVALVLVAALTVQPRASYADDNGGSQGESESGGQNHGSAVSQVARENESESESRNVNESASLRSGGDFKVTGVKVNSVDAPSNSLSVTFYGFVRTVSLAGAAIEGSGQAIAITDIQPGDILSGEGNYNEATHSLGVSRVIDVSYAARNTSNIQAQIDRLLQLVEQLQAQLKAMQSH